MVLPKCGAGWWSWLQLLQQWRKAPGVADGAAVYGGGRVRICRVILGVCIVVRRVYWCCWWGCHGGVTVRGRWVVEKNFGAQFLLSAILVSTVWPVGYQDTAKSKGVWFVFSCLISKWMPCGLLEQKTQLSPTQLHHTREGAIEYCHGVAWILFHALRSNNHHFHRSWKFHIWKLHIAACSPLAVVLRGLLAYPPPSLLTVFPDFPGRNPKNWRERMLSLLLRRNARHVLQRGWWTRVVGLLSGIAPYDAQPKEPIGFWVDATAATTRQWASTARDTSAQWVCLMWFHWHCLTHYSLLMLVNQGMTPTESGRFVWLSRYFCPWSDGTTSSLDT
jgi:hypothetical protein